jgi:hypothetical protein
MLDAVTPEPVLQVVPKLALAQLEGEIARMQSPDPAVRMAAAEVIISDGSHTAADKLESLLRKDMELRRDMLSKKPDAAKENMLPDEVRWDMARALMVLSTLHVPHLASDSSLSMQRSITLGFALRRRKASSTVTPLSRPVLAQR